MVYLTFCKIFWCEDVVNCPFTWISLPFMTVLTSKWLCWIRIRVLITFKTPNERYDQYPELITNDASLHKLPFVYTHRDPYIFIQTPLLLPLSRIFSFYYTIWRHSRSNHPHFGFAEHCQILSPIHSDTYPCASAPFPNNKTIAKMISIRDWMALYISFIVSILQWALHNIPTTRRWHRGRFCV